MKDGLSLTRIVVFFSALPVRERRGQRRVVGLLALDDLQQRHHRDRVEEVEADDPLGVLEVGGHLRDRQRRGVRRQHALRRDDLLDVGEHRLLDRHLLEDRLDHEVGVGEASALSTAPLTQRLEPVGLVLVDPALGGSLSISAWT